MKQEKAAGEQNKYDLIRSILRGYASREKPISRKGIEDRAKEMGRGEIGRTAIEGFMNEMKVMPYETEEECDEHLKAWRVNEQREIILCKTSKEGRRTKGYWMLESISDSEWMYLMDSVIYSKIMTKKEADNLAERITLLAGRKFSDFAKYRHRMDGQPSFYGDKEIDIDVKTGRIESRVLSQVHLIRKAIMEGKKVKFTLNVYKYRNQTVKLEPYGKIDRICSPFDVIYSNGRYYMLGADLETERREDLKYKLYRIDLMTDLSITRAAAATKEDAGIVEVTNLFKYRMENPYMYTGDVERVRIRVESGQFTQIVDWFGDNFTVKGYDANEKKYYDIEVEVNLNSFIFWVLQYSGCVEVIDTGRKGKDDVEKGSFRAKVREILEKALAKYKED